jgi:2-keto-3-deoxy-L-rhamnonate aldolase RhmA
MENRLKRKLADGALTFCLGVNQARTPNIAMIAAAAVETAGRAARSHGKSLGIGGVLFDHGLQTELVRLGARYLTAGNDVGYLLRAARADIERMRTIPVPRI